MSQPYQLTNGNSVLIVATGFFVPLDPDNADYQRYQVWLAEGNTPDPAPTLPSEG